MCVYELGMLMRYAWYAVMSVCVCLLLVRAKAKIKGNKYGATRSAGDYQRKVQLARLGGGRAGVCVCANLRWINNFSFCELRLFCRMPVGTRASR